jgi:hypothetical protein
MERFAATGDALTRCGRYATSVSAAPSKSSAASGTPQRQVVKWYCSLCQTARMQRRAANSPQRANVSEPTIPVDKWEPLTMAAIKPGHSTASSSARRRRPGQYGAFGKGARAYNNHMIKSFGRHGQHARFACKAKTPIAESAHRTVTVRYCDTRISVFDRPACPEDSATTESTSNVVMQLLSGQHLWSALYVRQVDPVSRVLVANARCLWTLTTPRKLPA